MNKIIFTAIISFITIYTFGQGFYEIEENFKLLNSGKKRVSIYEDSKLISFKNIDSTNRIITRNTLEPTKILDNSNAPQYDSINSISFQSISYYSSKGNIDSTILIDYTSPLLSTDGKVSTAKVDSTIIVYGFDMLNHICPRRFLS